MNKVSKVLKEVLTRIDERQLENNKANAKFRNDMRMEFKDKNLFKRKEVNGNDQ